MVDDGADHLGKGNCCGGKRGDPAQDVPLDHGGVPALPRGKLVGRAVVPKHEQGRVIDKEHRAGKGCGRCDPQVDAHVTGIAGDDVDAVDKDLVDRGVARLTHALGATGDDGGPEERGLRQAWGTFGRYDAGLCFVKRSAAGKCKLIGVAKVLPVSDVARSNMMLGDNTGYRNRLIT